MNLGRIKEGHVFILTFNYTLADLSATPICRLAVAEDDLAVSTSAVDSSYYLPRNRKQALPSPRRRLSSAQPQVPCTTLKSWSTISIRRPGTEPHNPSKLSIMSCYSTHKIMDPNRSLNVIPV